MSVNKRNNIAYGLTQALTKVFQEPIPSPRAPTTRDQAPIGTVWIDQTNDDAYIITRSAAGVNTWINIGGGGGIFANLTVNPGNVTITAGDLLMPAGSITLGALGFGVMQTNATGDVTSTNGTNGQILIAGTGIAPAWAAITSATLNVTLGANTINLEYPGGTAASFVTDAGGPVVPLLGVTSVIGYDANITTDGTVANTIQIRLADNIISTGTITSTVGFNVTNGTTVINSNTNAAQAIYLHANGGVNETIELYSELGTSNLAIGLLADVGGINISGGLNTAQAIQLNAFSAAGGITMDAGTGGVTINSVNGIVSILSGTGTMHIGDAITVHDTIVGSVTGASATTLQGGTGGLALVTSVNPASFITIDAGGVLELNSSGAAIGIGNDADAFNISIGTGAAQRVITIGNATAASSVVINGGTGAMQFGANGIAHATTLGSVTGAAASTLQAGTGALTINGGGILDIDAVGILSINSSAAAINIGNDAVAAAVNIATAGVRPLIVGSVTGASSTNLRAGTGGIDITAAGIVRMAYAVDTQAANAVTIDANVGKGTFTGLTTAAGAEEILTVNNALAAVNSPIMVTIASATAAADVMLTIQHVQLLNGSFKVYYVNQGTAALATDVILTFWILS